MSVENPRLSGEILLTRLMFSIIAFRNTLFNRLLHLEWMAWL